MVKDAPQNSNRILEFTRAVSDYIYNHVGEPITTEIVCEALSYNKSHFCRRFRQIFGITFGEYLYRYRIEHACQLIQWHPNVSLATIAGLCGFVEYTHFCRTFKKYIGQSPRDYRRAAPG